MSPTADEILADIEPEVRRTLVRVALEQFAEHGYNRTRTRDISAGAGLSPAALYVHFPSKEDLLYEISRAGHRAVLGLVEDACQSDGTAVERVRRLVTEFVTWHALNAKTARVIYREWAVLSLEHQTEIIGLRRSTQGLIRDLVETGVRTREFDVPSVSMATLALVSLGIDVSRWFRPGRGTAPLDIGRGHAELALRMLAPPPAGG